jgi:hypothetical protein
VEFGGSNHRKSLWMLAQSLLRALSNIKGIPGQRGGTVGLPVVRLRPTSMHNSAWLRMRGGAIVRWLNAQAAGLLVEATVPKHAQPRGCDGVHRAGLRLRKTFPHVVRCVRHIMTGP